MEDFLRHRWQAIVLAIVAVVFIVQNRHDTKITFLWMDLRSPMWLTLTAVTLLGVAIGVIVNRRTGRKP
ncbi:hypothetical protein JL108_01020 [Aeromicrobium sp. YIM 150415]|uniref:DUF1049 domain-containing protein n=1 Tax=Aeromicrobium piscarium TaxID=2590901 RepID=A0A554SQ86_9ACTN|nr:MULTISPECIES: hypothetical protein [Aeromicrobium]MBM9462006.1 hypothetical protein [Aeromicrobium sp. YIM 150415]TSD68521.1 hypothetical protein FNM00_02735 [Aeromicrobium piscarium]